MLPLVRSLPAELQPANVLRAFSDARSPLLLESVGDNPLFGRFSFFMANPIHWIEHNDAKYGDNIFQPIQEQLQQFSAETIPGLPPFQGGAAGLIGYEVGRAFERLPITTAIAHEIPVLAVGIYAWVIAWDHVNQTVWLVAHSDKNQSAESRGQGVLDVLNDRTSNGLSVDRNFGVEWAHSYELRSTFTRDAYLGAVSRVIEYIRAGDIFQANLAQQLLVSIEADPLDVYDRVRVHNPAPFAGYFGHDDWAIVSASPERFLRVNDRQVETRPIKGTRPRGANPEDDQRLRRELRNSEKDRAENVMIVDLLRNDLSKVSRPGSVRVPELCAIETYATVHHLVSTVRSEMVPTASVWDLLAGAFPGGSITGAPKIRAMEIIAELEQYSRGPYCGSLFYAGFNGQFDSSLLIRTMVYRDNLYRIGAGGGVTALSNPQAEYDESLDKAAGLLSIFSECSENWRCNILPLRQSSRDLRC